VVLCSILTLDRRIVAGTAAVTAAATTVLMVVGCSLHNTIVSIAIVGGVGLMTVFINERITRLAHLAARRGWSPPGSALLAGDHAS
jgi:hypothetical protein